MSLYARIAPRGPNGFGYGSTADDVTAGVDLRGKTVLLTGSTSGIGFESLRVLGARGAHVLATARTAAKAEAACKEAGVTSYTAIACELADPTSVRACVQAVKATGRALDVVLANAGIMALPKREVAFGYELQFFTNHIGHFLLVTSLLDTLSDAARVVVVSSEAHRNAPRGGIELDNLSGERGYTAWRAYGQSKFANILFAKGLAARFRGTRRVANALHPGVIHTKLARYANPMVELGYRIAGPIALKDIPQGAATQCFLAAHPSGADTSGLYFSDCNPKAPRRDAEDAELAERLWTKSEAIVRELP